MTGTIFDIQRFSVHDGPGIRTTVFFKGCPLRCAWCHNPEGLAPLPQVQFFEEKCIGCGRCGRRTILDVPSCPTEALTVCGQTVSEEQVMEIVLRDWAFYAPLGGLTLSGGECLQQADFARCLLQRAKAEGLHTAVDTSGCVPWKSMEQTLEYTDLYLYDVKTTDTALHKKWTGAGNELIQQNLHRLSAAGAAIWLRVPVIPDVNDNDDEMHRIAQLAASLPGVQAVTLMPYHTLGKSKYPTLGMQCSYQTEKQIPKARLEEWNQQFRSLGLEANGG